MATPNAVPNNSVAKKGRSKTITGYVSQVQAAVMINTLQEKALDIMKKSTAVYGLLQKYDANVGTVVNMLFSDRLFKAGILIRKQKSKSNNKCIRECDE